jgi:hypothetical protein
VADLTQTRCWTNCFSGYLTGGLFLLSTFLSKYIFIYEYLV